MFTLAIALFALAVIAGLFAVLGVAGAGAAVAAIAAGLLAVFSMVIYWKRRPHEGSSPA